MARLEVSVENIKTDVSEIKTNLNEFIGSAEGKFASKLTEKIVYGLCAVVLVAFITKLCSMW